MANNSNNTTNVNTTFAALVANNSAFVPKYWIKQVAQLLNEHDDADAAAIRWHLNVANLKVWGGACFAYANADKSALICRYPAKADKADKADKASGAPSLFALIDAAKASADALALATSNKAKNAAQVSAISASVEALTSAVEAINKANADKLAADEERAKKRRQAVMEALKYNGLTDEEADKLADSVKLVRGVKTAFGYAYKWDAVAASFNYVFRVKLDEARALEANAHDEALNALEAGQRDAATRQANEKASADIKEFAERCKLYLDDHANAPLPEVVDAAVNAAGGRVLGRRIVAAVNKGVILTDAPAVGVPYLEADKLAEIKAVLARPYVRPARRKAAAPDLTAPAADTANAANA